MKQRFLFVVPVAALAAGAIWLNQVHGHDSRAKRSMATVPSVDSESESDGSPPPERALEARGASQARAGLQAKQPSPRPVAPNPAPSAAAPLSEEQAREIVTAEEGEPHREVTKEEMLANIESVFEMEPVDPKWGASTTRDIYDTVRPIVGGNSEVRSVDCRSTLCRVESVQEDSTHYSAFVQKLKFSRISPEGFYTKTGETPDGRPILTMYLARNGHPMPQVE
jgi:hypothetical protein